MILWEYCRARLKYSLLRLFCTELFCLLLRFFEGLDTPQTCGERGRRNELYNNIRNLPHDQSKAVQPSCARRTYERLLQILVSKEYFILT